MRQPEEMAAFFDARAEGYDSHMYGSVGEGLYRDLASFLPAGDAPLEVLDLGCGTGLELPFLWERLPAARVTGIDLSGEMLARLAARFPEKGERLRLLQTSYLDWDYPQGAYDVILSCETMHHLEREPKLALYRKLLGALKPGGFYLEGDFVVSAEDMPPYWEEYERQKQALPGASLGGYHLDIPMTVEMQQALFEEAGFSPVEICSRHIRQEGSYAILRGTAAGSR